MTMEPLANQTVIRGAGLTAKMGGEFLCYQIKVLRQSLIADPAVGDPLTRSPFTMEDLNAALAIANPDYVCVMPAEP